MENLGVPYPIDQAFVALALLGKGKLGEVVATATTTTSMTTSMTTATADLADMVTTTIVLFGVEELLLLKFLVKEFSFQINFCDWCVANKIINGKQYTIGWDVNDLKQMRG